MKRGTRQLFQLRTCIKEVIPMKSKADRATAIIRQSRSGQLLTIGRDIGKYLILPVARWPDGTLERPWLVVNPE